MIENNKKMMYIASPYRTNNIIKKIKYIKYAKRLTLEAIYKGYIPITPHLFLTRILKDKREDERQLGLEMGQQLLERCDCILVGMKYGVSEGMKAEIEIATKKNIKIKLRYEEVRKEQRKQADIERDIHDYNVYKAERQQKKANRRRAVSYLKKAYKCLF